MAILANRVKKRSSLPELAGFILFSLKKFLALILIVSSCFILYFSSSRIISDSTLEFNGRVLHFGTLISQAVAEKVTLISEMVSYFSDLKTENLRLKIEIAELKNSNLAAKMLKAENESLRKILKVTDDVEFNYVTARVLGVSLNPFANTAIVQVGSLDGVEVDDIVVSGEGLVGRVTSVGTNYSGIMLITDHNSRIPVITGSSREKGILAKHGDQLKIIYLPENHQAKVGEAIYTSGDGKIYPYGLLVGQIKQLSNDELIVQTSANFRNLEFVMIQSRTNLKDTNI